MAIQQPPLSQSVTVNQQTSSIWQRWFYDLFQSTQDLENRPNIQFVETTITADSLDSGLKPVILTAASSTARYKVRNIILSGDGTNFDSGGDRDLAIITSDEQVKFSVIPSATLKSLAASRWGDTGVPFPTTASDLLAQTNAGTNIQVQYDGGSTGYSFAGSLTILLQLEKTVE